MSNFTFETLNDKDFEILSTDIISKVESVHVDRFKPGKDQGVDGRFFCGSDEIIIQVKHFLASGFTKMLYSCVHTEAPKVRLLSPKRYIFICSTPLSRLQKSKLKDAFSPFLDEKDIYGQENLNDLLELNPEIIKKHYKLWLTSSSVLDKLINNATFNHSKFTLNDIQSFSKFYVKTQNHINAMKVLEDTHCLVVSGQPGVGKTTLAQHICFELVGKGYEFVEIEEDINEGFQAYEDGKKQVFYFDDFLGSNYLDSVQRKESSSIVKFFTAIKNNDDKRFILTSRSSILNQTKNLTEVFTRSSFDRNEYELNINSLSKIDKANILYNRLYFSNMKTEYLDIIYQDKKYRNIIEHKNYNPRLIEFITNSQRYEIIKKEDYWGFIIKNLDNPKNIWKFAFNSQLEEYERILVYIVAFHNNKDCLTEARLEIIVKRYFTDTQYHISDNTFEQAIKILSGSFLNRTVYSDEIVELSLFNPSIADYLFSNIKKNKHIYSEIIYYSQTRASLETLQQIRYASLISSELRSSILKIVINNITHQKDYKENKIFVIKALGDYCSIDPVDTVDSLLINEVINDISTNSIDDFVIEDLLYLLKFLVSEKIDSFKNIDWNLFFNKVFLQHIEREELLLISNLINAVHLWAEIDVTLIKEGFTKEIIDYWSGEINNDVCDHIEYCQYDLLKDEITKHIKLVLSEYELDLEGLSEELIDYVDIDDIATGIAKSFSDHDFSNGDNDSSFNSYDQIDDLFDRSVN